jgi:FSR family fosmidomycin resistance protein-like MFS transporter
MIPVLAASLALVRLMPALSELRPTTSTASDSSAHDQRGAMGLLAVVIALRSIPWFTLLSFVSLWLVSLGHSKAYGNGILFIMLFAGALGTLALGPIADRVGLRLTLVLTQALTTPLMLVFVLLGGAVGVIALMLIGVCVVGTFGVTMVLSQQYLPKHVGMASGLSVGLSMGIGGIAAVGLGAVADTIDLKAALIVSAIPPLLGFVLSLKLPAPTRSAVAGSGTAVATAAPIH